MLFLIVYSIAFGQNGAPSSYRIEQVQLPESMSPEVSAVAFSPRGNLVIANRHGDIWIRDNESGWRRFAYGLHEPLGLWVNNESDIYVIHRPELTRVQDVDGDGEADRFRTISDAWGLTGNYHEFAYGLPRDKNGNFYGGLGLESAGEIVMSRGPIRMRRVLDERHRSVTPFRGWVFQIDPEGRFIPLAMGFRQPAGIGLSPEGDLFATDNQGDWVGSSTLVHVRKGHFYGHPASLKWSPDFSPDQISREKLWEKRTRPAIIFPHGPMGGSPGEPVWDLTEGKFGPFHGQIFIGDFSALISRVHLEKIAGEYQGACFPFIEGESIGQGNMRMAFAPDGTLYVAQTTRGWAEGEGLKRIVWTGAPLMELRAISLTETGFDLEFTEKPDPILAGQATIYRVRRFQYHYHEKYGSPRINESDVEVVRVSTEGGRVRLELAELRPGFIYRIEATDLTSVDGHKIENGVGYYTLNRLLNGETDRSLPVEMKKLDEVVQSRQPTDVQKGGELYRQYCAMCHLPDGRGSQGIGAASFVGPESPLAKSDDELKAIISAGKDDKGMPPFGSTLSLEEIQDVVAYLRQAFGR
ncbi:MAG TPA: c-type cytochrome [Acidobacteriota bacterium]|nr:c-type cytochrome [Acidobacteriota bacterium]